MPKIQIKIEQKSRSDTSANSSTLYNVTRSGSGRVIKTDIRYIGSLAYTQQRLMNNWEPNVYNNKEA